MSKFSMVPFEHNVLRGNLYDVDVKRISIFMTSYFLSPKLEYCGFDELIEQLIWHSLELSAKKKCIDNLFYYLSLKNLNRIQLKMLYRSAGMGDLTSL